MVSNANWGGSRQGAGRKKGVTMDIEHKDARIVIACSKIESEIIKEKAKQSGKSVSRFIVEKLISDTKI